MWHGLNLGAIGGWSIRWKICFSVLPPLCHSAYKIKKQDFLGRNIVTMNTRINYYFKAERKFKQEISLMEVSTSAPAGPSGVGSMHLTPAPCGHRSWEATVTTWELGPGYPPMRKTWIETQVPCFSWTQARPLQAFVEWAQLLPLPLCLWKAGKEEQKRRGIKHFEFWKVRIFHILLVLHFHNKLSTFH